MEKLRVAVVGLGAISGHHIESVIALDTATLVAVCDIKEDKVAAAKEKSLKNRVVIVTALGKFVWLPR